MIRNFDKCERCRKSPATIDCPECGTSSTRSMKLCYDCDKSYHSMFDKEKHTRKPIKFDSTTFSQTHAMQHSQSVSLINSNSKSPLRSSPLRKRIEDITLRSPLRQKPDIYKPMDPQPAGLTHAQTAFSTFKSNFLRHQEDDNNQRTLQPTQSMFSPGRQQDDDLLYSQRSRDQQLQRSALRTDREPRNDTSIVLQQIPYDHQSFYKRTGSIDNNVAYKSRTSESLQHFNPLSPTHQQPLSPQGSDLTQYYQKMGEEYRNKYLELEKDLIFFKNQHEYEIQKARNQALEDAERRFTERMQFDQEETDRRFRDVVTQKDFQINTLQKQILDLESRVSKEGKDVQDLQRLQQNLEMDYKQTFKDYELKMRDKDDRMERLEKEHEYHISKINRNHETEKENLKKDYEDLLKSVRLEYQRSNDDLRQQLELKTQELDKVNSQMKEMNDQYKREKNELQETLTKDKYNNDLYSRENEQLRQAKADFQQERDKLYADLQQLEAENERYFTEAKELRKKVKKLEHILYGRKQ